MATLNRGPNSSVALPPKSVWRVDPPQGRRFENSDVLETKSELIEKLGGEPDLVRCSRSGSLIIELRSMEQGENLLCMKTLGSLEISVSPHYFIKACYGTIHAKKLAEKSEDFILQALKSQNVVDVCRIQQKYPSSTPSPIFKLKFSTLDAPSHVRVHTFRFQVRSRMPWPTRCTDCQQFGHLSSKCTRKTPICSTCGKEGHTMTSCRWPVQCANCGGPHAASDRYCPAFLQEEEIIQLHNCEKIGLLEAQILARHRYPYTSQRR